MRNTTIVVVVLALALAFLPTTAWAQEEEQRGMAFGFGLSGFINVQHVGDGPDLGWTRIFPSLGTERLRLEFEIELHNLNQTQPEWLNEVKLVYQPNKNTSFRFGRFFRAFGYGTVAPVFLKTATYPAGYPYGGFYAYGVRVDRTQGNWTLKVDIVADPEGFREIDFGRPEFSFFAERKISEGLSVGASGRLSDSLAQGGVHFNAQVSEVHMFGGVFANDDKDQAFSGLFFSEWRVLDWLHPHTLIAFGDDGEWAWTNGVTFVGSVWERELKFITDFDGEEFLFRTQFRF